MSTSDTISQVEHGYNIAKQGVVDVLKSVDDYYLRDLLEAAIKGREAMEPISDDTIDVLLRLVQPTLWGELVRRLELEELEHPA